ncbi:HNH endonuclease [Salmonella enterica]|nr:HNH endonuclease [Salmonella enterica]
MTDLLKYNPETGVLSWAKPRGGVKVGKAIGSRHAHGYLQMTFMGKKYLVHRFIWDLVHPDDKLGPGEEIDHINHVKDDNRLCNLRKVKRLGNCQNVGRSKRNTSGVTGVSLDPINQKWVAQIKCDGEYTFLGRFTNFGDAVEARKNAERELGFHENHGMPEQAGVRKEDT